MAFGDTAKTALEKALEAFKAVVRVEAIVEQIQKSVQTFEQRIILSLESHARRTDDRIESGERRSSDKFEAHERRLREMEARMAAVEGRVESALATALRLAIDEEIKRKVEKEAKLPAVSALSANNAGGKLDSTDA